MRLGFPSFFILISLGLFSMTCLSNSGLILLVNSIKYDGDGNPSTFNPPSRTAGSKLPIENSQVEIVKSFKNSSGFYKINGTIENNGFMILTHIQVIKYYKFPSVNDTTLVCYEQTLVNCEYKSDNSQLPSKSFFMMMPPTPSQTDIN